MFAKNGHSINRPVGASDSKKLRCIVLVGKMPTSNVCFDVEAVKHALSSVTVFADPNHSTGCHVDITVPVTGKKESVSFSIWLNGNELKHVVVDVKDADGILSHSGFVAPGHDPVCPIYKHIGPT